MLNLLKNRILWTILATAIVVFSLNHFQLLQPWQYDLYDFFIRQQNIETPSNDVIIIAIDDKSLSDPQVGRFQDWRRSFFGETIQTLDDHGTKVIGVDISMPEPSLDPSQDQELAEIIAKAGNVIMVVEVHDDLFLQPVEPIASALHSVGYANVSNDQENTIRSVPPLLQKQDNVLALEAFPLQVARTFLDQDQYFDFTIRNLDEDNQTYRFDPNSEIPLQDNRMLINYFGPPHETFPAISLIDLLHGNIIDQNNQPVDLTNKIALIGVTAKSIQDTHPTPTSQGKLMPGIEIHGHIINTLLAQKFLHPISPGLSSVILIISVTIISIIFSRRLKGLWASIVCLMIIASVLLLSFILFQIGILIDPVSLIFITLLVFITTTTLHFLSEQAQRRFLHGAFSRYLNPDVIKQIQDNPDILKLGGERKEVTIFFSDIAGFTTISEKSTPEELVSLLNEYLGAMTDIILKYDGTLDKYEGDAIMAFWGAPLDQPDHAERAIHASIEQLEKLDELRAKWKFEERPDVNIRIGINTGQVIVGNMGSEQRFDYTIMGDPVNLAARLEALNKNYNTRLMASEFTWEKIKDKFQGRKLDRVRVKGKEELVTVYEIIKEREIDSISKLNN